MLTCTGGSQEHISIAGTGFFEVKNNIEVFQNIVHSNQNNGITLASEMRGLLLNIKVYNNKIYNNKYVGISLARNGPVDAQPMRNILIINNTVYNNGFGDWGGGIAIGNQDIQNLLTRNNIVNNNLSFQIAAEEIKISGFEIDHNLVYPFKFYPGEIHRLVEADPMFLNPGGKSFHLQSNSPAIDKGFMQNAPEFDFDGNLRPK